MYLCTILPRVCRYTASNRFCLTAKCLHTDSRMRRNAFRINTCTSLSKQTTLTVIESHSYKKHRGWGVLWLTSSRLVVSGHSLSSHFSLLAQDSPQISSFVFKGFRTLSFSVSRKSCICHSYENCRVYTNNSHFGATRASMCGKLSVRGNHGPAKLVLAKVSDRKNA